MPQPPRALWRNLLLAVTVFLSAWLLFQVQPMAAKRILPWFGGGTAVWTTTTLFFQTALLAGYLYAHLSTRFLSPTRQALVHALLLAAVVLLAALNPVIPAEAWKPPGSDWPAVHILAMLAACLGPPFVMLAATAPLAQVWFSRANPGRSPYRLYALSNVGSLAALLSYPFVVEPALGLARQSVGWTALFAVFALCCGASALLSLSRGGSRPAEPAVPPEEPTLAAAASSSGAPEELLTAAPSPFAAEPAVTPPAPELATAGRPPRLELFFWLALPACASVVLLAITQYLCQDVASMPLLWILPLAVYLVSFILSFDSDRWYRRWVWLAALAFTSFWACQTWGVHSELSYIGQMYANLGLLLSVGMVCHGELARMRPKPERLTGYFLCISAGGALGGALAAIAAPLVLPGLYELQLGILAAWILALGVLVTDRQSEFYDGRSFPKLLGMCALLAAVASVMYGQAKEERGKAIARTRNFYGVLAIKVRLAGTPVEHVELNNGRITHGSQYTAVANRRVPTEYYMHASAVGQLMLAPRTAPRRVGVVGLGAGTLAAYAESGDHYRFYEINPLVIEYCEDYFSFLKDARQRGAEVTIVQGDARLSLEAEPPQNFDMLILDAFSGDAIPVHLLTLEAFELYLRHLKDPDGVLAVHVSNIHLDLKGVVLAAAQRYKLETAHLDNPPDDSPASSTSEWILLHRGSKYLEGRSIGTPLADAMGRLPPVKWTDDFSNLLEILR